MSRQAVIETGSWTVKAGLWEQTFIPTTRIPSFARIIDGRPVFGGSFAEIDEGQEELLVRPIIDGKVVDFKLLESLWRHVLGTELGLMEPWTDVCVLLIVPGGWGRDVLAECLRICFERFGVAGVYFGETPVLASLGCAQASSIVLDFGHTGTDVSIVWDGHLVRACSERYPVGGRDVDSFLAGGLNDLIPADIPPKVFARAFKETAKLSDDGKLISFSYKGQDLKTDRVGLLTSACQLYFQFDDGKMGLEHFILSAILNAVEADRRPILLDSVILTGLGSQLPGLADALTKALTAVLSVSTFPADHQSGNMTIRHVPEYYPEVWRAAGPVAAWFGAGITAKMVFPDPKAHYTREEYSQLGAQLLVQKPL